MTSDSHICILQKVQGEEERGLNDVNGLMVLRCWKTQSWVELSGAYPRLGRGQDTPKTEGPPSVVTAVGPRCSAEFLWDLYEFSPETVFLPRIPHTLAQVTERCGACRPAVVLRDKRYFGEVTGALADRWTTGTTHADELVPPQPQTELQALAPS